MGTRRHLLATRRARWLSLVWWPAVGLLAVGLMLGLATCAGGPAVPSDQQSAAPPAAVASGTNADASVGTNADASVGTNADAAARELVVDPTIIRGNLANGLTYLIMPNGEPRNRVSLRLAINAGSILESDDQRGLAHFVEHMAFNGTQRFPEQELVRFLEQMGIEFGADINAYTSFDETVYELEIPADDPQLLETAIAVLADWLTNISFDPVQVDLERGVIVEEWRSRRGANARLSDRRFDLIFAGNLYAERLPIGDIDIVRNSPVEQLTAFYRRWYRPQLAAVVVVGEVQPTRIVELIEQHFSPAAAAGGDSHSTAAGEIRPEYDFQFQEGNRFEVFTDPELTLTALELYVPQPPIRSDTVAGIRSDLVEYFVFQLFNERLSRLAEEGAAAFASAGAGRSNVLRTMDVIGFSIIPRDGRVTEAFEQVVREFERAQQFGFLPEELDRQKQNLLQVLPLIRANLQKRDSRSLSATLADAYLNDTFVIDPAFELDLYAEIIPTVTIGDLSATVQAIRFDLNNIVLLSAPDTVGDLPTTDDLSVAFERARAEALVGYQESAVDRELLSDPISRGLLPAAVATGAAVAGQDTAVVEEQPVPHYDAVRWELANGVTVYYRYADFTADRVSVFGYSPGGLSRVADADLTAARTAVSVVGQAGFGGFSPSELSRLLAGNSASAQPFINEYSQGVEGAANSEHLETLFQLLFLTMTSPNRSETAFRLVSENISLVLQNRDRNPEAVFADTITRVLTNDHPRRRPLQPSDLAAMDLDRSLQVYRDAFATARGMNFVVVGDVPADTVRQLAGTYLAALPAEVEPRAWVDRGVRPAFGPLDVVVARGVEPKSQVRLYFAGETAYSRDEAFLLSTVAGMMQVRLREVIREDLSGTYGVGVGASIERLPIGAYQSMILFGTDPDRVDELTAAAIDVVHEFQQNEFDDRLLTAERETYRRNLETARRTNAFWMNAIVGTLQSGEAFRDIESNLQRLNALTRQEVADAARRFFPTDQAITIVLQPADQQPAD